MEEITMKTKEELNALKNEVETLNGKLAELSEDELKQIVGGMKIVVEEDEESSWYQTILDFFFKIKK